MPAPSSWTPSPTAPSWRGSPARAPPGPSALNAGTGRIGTLELPRAGEVVVIAEAGVNHDGDPALAHRLVDVAADAGADAVKFQTFDPDRLVSAAADATPYQRARG